MKQYIFLTLSAVALAGCQSTTAPVTGNTDPLTSALAGKTLLHSNGGTVIAYADGRMGGTEASGEDLVGAWVIRDGQWCRTIKKPEKWAGTRCQDVTIDGDQATFLRDDGSSTTYTIQ